MTRTGAWAAAGLGLVAATAAGVALALRRGLSDTSGADAHRLVEAGALLLDVRTRREFERGHPPEARNIPVQELRARLAEVGPRERPVVVYCHAGPRAVWAQSVLQKAGYEVHNLGALRRW